MPEWEELRAIRVRRARLDAEELELIDRARRGGATWTEIAAALGLASRQAAEQRRARLAQASERASLPHRRELDRGYGPGVPELRKRSIDLHRRIGADRRWDGRFTRAALVRETLAAAGDAPAGALYDLVAAVLGDLAGPEAPSLPAELRTAVERLREAFVIS
ncbi:hypothetical protein QLQ12_04985 [Actinoplanes sp. NEAU-A12]|uniref:Uncharacterized protein n=1 Tax=Actinoplanes sandaracinus TaxID=3045177 RepID=A0ABT6WE08_9ACTN|nr:hypothetical protein [Actinoplanes sandaracinus]MDI6097954.1 hypothetical protein [Actinoplanes sandaracinus]